MKVLITGSSGLIGGALASSLRRDGEEVLRLVRRETVAVGEIPWYPQEGRIEASALEGLDAVVHLAGESIGAGRWSERRKRTLRESRIQPTRLLAETLASLSRRPAVLVSASGIGYYGDRGAELLREPDGPGKGFLPDLARDWEAAALPAEAGGVRTVALRTGMVLSLAGGALPRLLLPLRLGAVGPIGSGRQYMSWITLEDMLGVIRHAIASPALSGPVNAVSPNPVTNLEFTRTLARTLNRAITFPMPALLARLALGEMGETLLLASQRAIPMRLLASGYDFLHPELEKWCQATLSPI